MKLNKIAKLSLAAATVLTTYSCSPKEDGGQPDTLTAKESDIALIDVDVAHTVTVPHTASYTANVEADNINNIAPAMSNRIKSITVDVGDQVRKGQTLVTLDPSNADQLRINLELSRREYERAVELLNIGAGTQRAVDQVKAQLDALQSQYDNMMDNTVLVSPINGVVTARNYDPGDMTGAMPVLTIGQITPQVKVVINVNESDISRVKRGTEVEISLDAFPDRTFTGRVTRLSPAVDVNTRTFSAEVALPNPKGEILPGMFARVTVNLGDRESVVVPDRAIDKQKGSNNKYVYVYHDGKVSYNRVELGRRIDNGFELLSGINDGDTVVIAGQSRLADGAPAQINKKN